MKLILFSVYCGMIWLSQEAKLIEFIIAGDTSGSGQPLGAVGFVIVKHDIHNIGFFNVVAEYTIKFANGAELKFKVAVINKFNNNGLRPELEELKRLTESSGYEIAVLFTSEVKKRGLGFNPQAGIEFKGQTLLHEIALELERVYPS
jgi:hypothetical protein